MQKGSRSNDATPTMHRGRFNGARRYRPRGKVLRKKKTNKRSLEIVIVIKS